MTRQEAIDFVDSSNSMFFRYGDLGYYTSRVDALKDIKSMEDGAWNSGIIYGEDN